MSRVFLFLRGFDLSMRGYIWEGKICVEFTKKILRGVFFYFFVSEVGRGFFHFFSDVVPIALIGVSIAIDTIVDIRENYQG